MDLTKDRLASAIFRALREQPGERFEKINALRRAEAIVLAYDLHADAESDAALNELLGSAPSAQQEENPVHAASVGSGSD